MIVFTIDDQSYVQLRSDVVGELKTLQSIFSFDVPNAKYSPQYQKHLWDGRVSLIDLKHKCFVSGLLPHVLKICDQNHIQYEVENNIEHIEENLSDFDYWLKSLRLPFQPRDYQLQSTKLCLENQKQLIISSTGSGKSFSIYLLIRWHHQFHRKIVLIVPSTSLVEQMLNDFDEYSANDKTFNVKEVCQGLYGGKNTDPSTAEILVTTWQSICHYDNEIMESWDVVITDEAHKVAAKVLKSVVSAAVNARFKNGFTGSLNGDLLDEYNLLGLFNKITKVTSTVQLQQSGTLSPLKVTMITLKHNKDWVKQYYNQFRENGDVGNLRTPTHIEEVDSLNGYERRNQFIRNLILACKGTTLMLFNRKAHGKHLYDLVKQSANGRQVFHIDGDVDGETRERIRETINNEKNCILIASAQTSATGINIPGIENLIILPSKSRIRNLQSVGRGLRVADGKSACNCFILVDDFSNYRRHKSYNVNQAMQQWEIFVQEKFDISFKTIDF